MSYNSLIVERDGPAFIITLNRPGKKNAFNLQMKQEFLAALKEAEDDTTTRAIVITGGMAFFSAGQDLNEALEAASPASVLDMVNSWHDINDAMQRHPKPVFAAIEGFCITGGFELVLACDIRIAAEGATFAITSSKIGTVPGAGGTQRLPRLVGPAKAMEILFSADPIDAAEAHRIGIVNHVVPKGQALVKAKEMIQVYDKRAPLSLAYIKRAVQQGMQMDLRSAIDLETFIVTTVYGTADKLEGISAFHEKREANFKGK
jgi:enoyl-CoA hydratase/carnithine racemase